MSKKANTSLRTVGPPSSLPPRGTFSVRTSTSLLERTPDRKSSSKKQSAPPNTVPSESSCSSPSAPDAESPRHALLNESTSKTSSNHNPTAADTPAHLSVTTMEEEKPELVPPFPKIPSLDELSNEAEAAFQPQPEELAAKQKPVPPPLGGDCAVPRMRKKSTAAASPKGYEKFMEIGKQKREKRLTLDAEESKQLALQYSFSPKITEKAEGIREKSGSRVDVVESNYKWDSEKERRLEKITKQVALEREREIESTMFHNERSEAIVSANVDPSSGRRPSAFVRLQRDEEKRKENKEKLIAKHTPSFQPNRETRTDLSDTPVHQDVEQFYARVMDCRRKSELKVEDMKQAEKALSATPKITSGQFNQTLQRMQEREERKRAKLARKEEEAAQKELAEVREGPTINKASEQLAARSRRRPTHHCQLPPEEPQHNSVASRKVNFRDFERRQMILEERRRERVENLVLEVAQAELEECTFKPAILNGGTPAPSDVSVVSHHTEFSPSYATDSRTPWCGVKDDLADLEETLVTWEELALDVED